MSAKTEKQLRKELADLRKDLQGDPDWSLIVWLNVMNQSELKADMDAHREARERAQKAEEAAELLRQEYWKRAG